MNAQTTNSENSTESGIPEEMKRFHRQMTTRRKVVGNLYQIIDPELGVNMVDLGLVYNVMFLEDQKMKVEYAATTPGCPMRRYFQNKIEEAFMLAEVDDFEAVLVNEPQWSIEMMNAELRSNFSSPPSYQAPGLGGGFGRRR